MKVHFAPPEAHKTMCGRYCYNNEAMQITTAHDDVSCIACQKNWNRLFGIGVWVTEDVWACKMQSPAAWLDEGDYVNSVLRS